jgi:hypothetical protein
LILLSITAFLFISASIFVLFIILKKKMQYWIVSDVKRGLINFFRKKPKDNIHIMFAFADHFEPGNQNATLEQQKERVDAWVQRYPKLASKHQDSDGVPPQHTFFFPPHYDTHDHLEKIVNLCSEGFGEIEMHLHHDRMEPWPDNESTLREKILDCIKTFSRYDIFCLPGGRKTYGFIHGDWALANSLKGGEHCGINNELSILKETGCYADFTFPISNEAQPKLVNTIFYGQTISATPKAYNKKMTCTKVGNEHPGGLLLIQGVIGLRWKSRIHLFKPSIEQSNISRTDFPFPARIDYWVKKGIHVEGKSNWIFIKIHGHGAIASREDREMLLSKEADDMFTYLESKYNDNDTYFLHYVSAREMYNIIKAAEDGRNGNPCEYRDYVVPRYRYLPERKKCDRSP